MSSQNMLMDANTPSFRAPCGQSNGSQGNFCIKWAMAGKVGIYRMISYLKQEVFNGKKKRKITYLDKLGAIVVSYFAIIIQPNLSSHLGFGTGNPGFSRATRTHTPKNPYPHPRVQVSMGMGTGFAKTRGYVDPFTGIPTKMTNKPRRCIASVN